MKSQAVVKMEYKKALEQASKLEKYAKDISVIGKTGMQNELNSLSSQWKGEGANAFFRKISEMQAELSSVSGYISKVAESIRSSAERTYRAEMRAIQLAKQRDAH
ncbi:MAG: WXG100 family type VII secretion target [Porcipelethomonas sp.]